MHPIVLKEQSNQRHSPHFGGNLPRISWLLVVVMWLGTPAGAGSLAVTDSAAYNGVYGLEVTVGSSCTSAADPVFDSETVSGAESFEGCNTLTAHTNFVVKGSGDATLTAGKKITLGNGFSVESGGTFTAVIDASLTPFAFVQDDSPSSETSYNAEFYVNLDLLTVGGGADLEHFVAYGAGGASQLRLLVESGPSLHLEVRNDAGTFQPTSGVTASAGWNKINIAWSAASGATPSLTVNDGTPVQVTANTGTRRIDYVRWGAVGGSVSGTSGEIAQDDFSSWR
jgi:hypothetical protein